ATFCPIQLANASIYGWIARVGQPAQDFDRVRAVQVGAFDGAAAGVIKEAIYRVNVQVASRCFGEEGLWVGARQRRFTYAAIEADDQVIDLPRNLRGATAQGVASHDGHTGRHKALRNRRLVK